MSLHNAEIEYNGTVEELAEYLDIYQTPTIKHFQRLFARMQLSEYQLQTLSNLSDPGEILLMMEQLGLVENVPF